MAGKVSRSTVSTRVVRSPLNLPGTAKIPVQKSLHIVVGDTAGSEVLTIYTVPAGYHFVVEYASIQGALPAGQLLGLGVLTKVGDDQVIHFVGTASDPNGLLLGVGQMVQLHADPGTEVQIQWWRNSTGGCGPSGCELTATISGYLER